MNLDSGPAGSDSLVNVGLGSGGGDSGHLLSANVGGTGSGSLADLVVRYDALHWLMLEQDDVIMDAEARRAFIAFGRALKRMAD